MSASSTLSIVLSAISTTSVSLLTILGFLTAIVVGLLVFKFGFQMLRWSTNERGIWVGNHFYGSFYGKIGRHKASEL